MFDKGAVMLIPLLAIKKTLNIQTTIPASVCLGS